MIVNSGVKCFVEVVQEIKQLHWITHTGNVLELFNLRKTDGGRVKHFGGVFILPQIVCHRLGQHLIDKTIAPFLFLLQLYRLNPKTIREKLEAPDGILDDHHDGGGGDAEEDDDGDGQHKLPVNALKLLRNQVLHVEAQ